MMKTSRFLLAACILLALVFTFSCSGDDGSDGTPGTNGEPGQNGTSCVSEDGGAYLVIKCGEQQSKLPKAMCGATAYDPETQFCDSRNIQLYTPVKIGEQTWMKENLNYNASGSKCYDNDPSNCAKYGRLYSWEAAEDACPTGWHLPSDEEWETLITTVGGLETAGGKLKATSGWSESDNGTDDYGFSALPGGFVAPEGDFGALGVGGWWWSISEDTSKDAYSHHMTNLLGSSFPKSFLFSVRCLKTELH